MILRSLSIPEMVHEIRSLTGANNQEIEDFAGYFFKADSKDLSTLERVFVTPALATLVNLARAGKEIESDGRVWWFEPPNKARKITRFEEAKRAFSLKNKPRVRRSERYQYYFEEAYQVMRHLPCLVVAQYSTRTPCEVDQSDTLYIQMLQDVRPLYDRV